VQASVAQALANIHTWETLPYLASLLQSEDPWVSYTGLRGIALFANGIMPGPYGVRAPQNPQPYTTEATRRNFINWKQFAADPAPYVSFWQAWVANLVTVSIAGATSCHPAGPNRRCSVSLTATAADTNGSPITYAWSGCASGTSSTATCVVSALQTFTATVTASNGQGKSASASTTVTGTDATRP